MSKHSGYLFAAPAVLILVSCAGCDVTPERQRAASETSLKQPISPQQGLKFDRQQPGSANQVPALEGTAGRLSYRPGCLFLDVGGDEIGLIVPAKVTFDGKQLIGRLRTPQGQPIVRQVGQLVSVTGPVLKTAGEGRISCDTERVLIADQF